MTKINLDATDRKILKLLVKNARMPFLDIARECRISGAAIHQRIKKLSEQGIIQGSHLSVNPKTLGFDVCAFVYVRIKDALSTPAVIDRIRQIPEIVECHFVTGNYTLMLKIYCVSNEHLMNTITNGIQRIAGVSSTETYLSLEETFSREPHIDCLDQ